MTAYAHHIVAAALVAVPAAAADAATVREANVAVVFARGECEVSIHLAVDTADPTWVEHRLLLRDEDRAPAFVVTGAVAAPVETIGRTARLPISLTATGRNEYEVRYRLPITNARLDRCSLLVPSAPTDGIGRAVVIEARLPQDARRLPGEFPAFTWTDLGRITLAHIPSFIRVPYATADERLSWRDRVDIRRMLDIASLVTIVAATIGWWSFHRRRA